MKKIFIFFSVLFLLVSLNSVGSTSVVSNQLQMNFNLEVGVEKCQTLSITSDAANVSLNVRDVWANNYVGDDSNKFEKTSSDYGIDINYEENIFFDSAKSIEIKLCATSSREGKYKGKLVYNATNQNTGVSSIIVIPPWISIVARESVEQTGNQQETSQNSGGGSSGGKSSSQSGGGTTIQNNEEETEGIAFQELKNGPSNDEDVGITGNAVGDGSKSYSWIFKFLPLVVLAGIIGARVYVGKRRKNNYGFRV